MAKRNAAFVTVGRRKIELSNLKKVLFPADGIVKAEIIQYYLSIAPTLLRHVRGRPLSLVRFPDGVDGESFFQKNRQDWAPDWVEYVRLGGESAIDYVLATEDASLVWLANLACLEIHQMHCRAPHFDKPDYMVFDLDPPENHSFPAVVGTALALRERLDQMGYHPFVKTTGGKGVHVVVPLVQRYSFDQVFEAAKSIAQPFADMHRDTTLHIKKEQRKGRILIDIYRIRPAQTIIAAYSIRGRAGAPVAMPLSWDELAALTDPGKWDIHTVMDRVTKEGDAWQAIDAHAALLHTEKKAAPKRKAGKKGVVSQEKGPVDDTDLGHGSAGAGSSPTLALYKSKRSFDKTSEPPVRTSDAGESTAMGDAFVLHRHHASRLHYDLRLEKEGTLKCWAVPKGLPPKPGIKRLAVQTEDHPLKYLDFFGTIAKGQYGAGEMWVYARGRYVITKEKKDGFYVRLASPELTAEYRMIHTRGTEWLVERIDKDQRDWLSNDAPFMLAFQVTQVPADERYLFEVKWDGIRAMITLDEGRLVIQSRSGRDITNRFPELITPEALRASNGVFDGEIVCLDMQGRPEFHPVIRRLQQSSESGIARMRAKHPVVCYLFDCLYLDGREITGERLERRRQWLRDVVIAQTSYRFSESIEDGAALFQAARELGLEGVMAKDGASVYTPGRRSQSWLKVKVRSTSQMIILGFTEGEGGRSGVFGAIHVGLMGTDGSIVYRGRVGSGFDEGMLMSLNKVFRAQKRVKPLTHAALLDDAQSTWIEPNLVCDVKYASLTADKMLREGVFIRMRPDLTPQDCALD